MNRSPILRKWAFVSGKLKTRKRRKPSERTRLREALDTAFSLYIRLRGKRRNGGLCELGCGRRADCAFHFLSRGNLATRWTSSNAVASCRGCNKSEFMDRREAAKAKWREKHVALVGEATRLDLEAKARAITKLSNDDLRAMLADIRAKTETVCVGTTTAGILVITPPPGAA